MHFITILLFVLLFSAFRLFELGDSLQGIGSWLISAAVLIVGCGLWYWKARGFKAAVLVSGILLVSSFICLRFTLWSGYSVSIADSTSNMPTIRPGDLAINKWFNLSLQPGDMVGVKVDGKHYRKRVHGVPGDVIDICNHTVYVNGWHYSAANNWLGLAKSDTRSCFNRRSSLTLADDEYFLLGDNTANSYDSRSYGAVSASAIFANSLYLLVQNKSDNVVPLNAQFRVAADMPETPAAE
ncbi:signal peptidase I [Arsukibacterium perlucidum]|uniref:signal peptidase I n=1 Tax=Arsukibacterium perlucidum TaxID=368811 RepID=UPI000364B24C|nr:signal peptidase I [Arsukibacterium perlucidum]